eukprot:gene37555-45614_t
METTSKGQPMVFEGGGGAGLEGLSFENVTLAQNQMYRRTIGNWSEMMIKNVEQEQRQLKITETLVTITVQVSREDFPSIRGNVTVQYFPTAAQQVWSKFLSDICKLLKIEFVHSVLERGDRAPVNRILRLKDGGDYLVRQRESSAVLEVLNTHAPPIEHSWPITQKIVGVKKDLQLGVRGLPTVHNRIVHLTSQLLTSRTEKETAEKILAAKQPLDVVVSLCLLYLDSETEVSEEELSLLPLNTQFHDIARFLDTVDILSLHRLALETLNRFSIKDPHTQQLVAKQTAQYILKVLEGLAEQLDLVVLAMRLLEDLLVHFVAYKERCFTILLRVMKMYAPAPAPHRSRDAGALAAIPALPSTSFVYTAPTTAQRKSNAPALPRRDLQALSRYKDTFASATDQAKYMSLAKVATGYAKVLELDENLQVITPRSAQRRREEEELRNKPKVRLHERVVVEEEKKPQIFIRGRERVDHSSVKSAFLKATHSADDPTSSSATAVSGQHQHWREGQIGKVRALLSDVGGATGSNNNAMLVREETADHRLQHQQEHGEFPALIEATPGQSLRPSALLAAPKRPAYRIRRKKLDEEDDKDDDVPQDENTLLWRGSKGALGRAAIDKR